MPKLGNAMAMMALLVSVNSECFAADFYKDKTVLLIAGGNAGGSYDTHARLVAAHLGKHIPGNPAVIIQSMPGAGGVAAANHVFNISKKDGTELVQVNRDALIRPLLGDDFVKFKLAEYNWLGTPTKYDGNAFAIFVRSDLPYRSMDDLRNAKTPVNFGARSLFVPLIRDALGANIKIILGYKGEEDYLALERGEIDGLGGSYADIPRQKPEWLAKNFIRFVTQFGSDTRLPQLADAPTGRELAKTPADLALIKFSELSLTLGVPFAAPPGVPNDRVALLRKAFDDTMVDPEYVAALKKVGLEYSPKGGQALGNDMQNATTSASPEIIERYKRLIGAIAG
jgi:tripartite-type tricarboxylate transporter receptor subunit TctC